MLFRDSNSIMILQSLDWKRSNLINRTVIIIAERRFLKDYCSKIQHIANAFLHKANVETSTLRKTQAKVNKQMDEITKEHQLVVRKLKTMLDDSIKAIRKAFVTHLKSKDVKKAISQWRKEDLPMLASGDTWYEFEANILDPVQATLNRIVYRWEQTSNFFAKRQDALIAVFDDHFNQLECKLRNAQLMIEGRSPTRHDTTMTHESIKVEDLLATVQDFHSVLLAGTSIKYRVPAGIMYQVTLPFFFMRDVFSEMKGTSKAAKNDGREILARYDAASHRKYQVIQRNRCLHKEPLGWSLDEDGRDRTSHTFSSAR